MFRLLFLIFLIVPIMEIYVLIEIGNRIGALSTVALVVFTAVLGAALMRAQGFATVQRLQQELNQGEIPAVTLLEGVVILIAGALLLTPGFVTDAFGFACLVPPWRRAAISSLAARLTTRMSRGAHAGSGTVIDGEFIREDPMGPSSDPGMHKSLGPRD